jgi:hypothetical protein
LVSTPAQARRYGPSDELVGHFRRYDGPMLEKLVIDVGLTEVEVRHWGFPLGYALEAARNRIARRRLEDGWRERSVAERSAASGRWLQPPDVFGVATWVAAAPFRLLQRPFEQTTLGTGLLLAATKPS